MYWEDSNHLFGKLRAEEQTKKLSKILYNTEEYLFMENQTNIQVGDIIDGEVVRIEQYGAFVRVADRRNGLVHISQLADEFVKNVADYVQVGDVITVKVINIDENGRISLSRKDVDAE